MWYETDGYYTTQLQDSDGNLLIQDNSMMTTYLYIQEDEVGEV